MTVLKRGRGPFQKSDMSNLPARFGICPKRQNAYLPVKATPYGYGMTYSVKSGLLPVSKRTFARLFYQIS
jgi:hypothetical protein